MRILVINRGSSSLKYQLIDMENEGVVAKGLCERIGIEGSKLARQPPDKGKFAIEKSMSTHKTTIEMVMEALQDADYEVIKDISKIPTTGHRVLHGGTVYSGSIVMNKDVKRVIRERFDLGPLHNLANLMGIEACEVAMSGTPNVAVFDITFGMFTPEKAYTYAIPHEHFERYGICRYGFRETGHKFVSAEAIEFDGLNPKAAKVIVRHLGNGSSMSASIGGKCVDTSVELTPLEGLIMGTRSGDVDPVVLQLIVNKEGFGISEMLNILNKKSGVYGMIDGTSNDFRGIENAKVEGNHLAEAALDAFTYRVTKYVDAYAAAMNGVDVVVFTAGVGENDKAGRKATCEDLAYMGARIDDEFSDIYGEERVISSADPKVGAMPTPTNEELVIARETLDLVQ